MPSTTETVIKFENLPEIRGLIESLTEVASASVPVVEGWDADVSETVYEGRMRTLRQALIDLNTYVDEVMSDE